MNNDDHGRIEGILAEVIDDLYLMYKGSFVDYKNKTHKLGWFKEAIKMKFHTKLKKGFDEKALERSFNRGWEAGKRERKKEVAEKLEKLKREDMESPSESSFKGENYIREIIARENYNNAIDRAIKIINNDR